MKIIANKGIVERIVKMKQTKERREYVKENRINMTVKELAHHWNVSTSTIEKDLIWLHKEEKMPTRKEERLQRIRRLKKKSYSVDEIARDLHISKRAVYYYLEIIEQRQSS